MPYRTRNFYDQTDWFDSIERIQQCIIEHFVPEIPKCTDEERRQLRYAFLGIPEGTEEQVLSRVGEITFEFFRKRLGDQCPENGVFEKPGQYLCFKRAEMRGTKLK